MLFRVGIFFYCGNRTIAIGISVTEYTGNKSPQCQQSVKSIICGM